MVQHFTLFSTRFKRLTVLGAIKRVSNLPLTTTETDGAVSSIRLDSPLGSLTFNFLVRQQPGDKFCQVVLGAYAYFDRVQTDDVSRKESIKSHLDQCKMIIGVAGEPQFDEENLHFDCIEAVAKALQA